MKLVWSVVLGSIAIGIYLFTSMRSPLQLVAFFMVLGSFLILMSASLSPPKPKKLEPKKLDEA